MKKYYRVYADIDLDAVRKNLCELKSALDENTGIIAVIKADGYGHGAVPVAKAVDDIVFGYAVATIDEALNLRANHIEKPILILGYTAKDDYDRLIENDVTATVFDYETAKNINDAAVRLGKMAKCHIKIDTGMRRIGMKPDEANLEVVKAIKELPYLDAEGIFTHFAAADECDKTSANKQFADFMGFTDKLAKLGITFKYRHCANSAAIIDMPQTSLELARAGIAMYGMYPSDFVNKRALMLFPALELKSHVIMVKDVEANEGISYGATYVTDVKTRVATIPVGYGDGYPRSLSNKGYVLINGKRANILGRVCMDQMMVDVSGIEGVEEGTDVTLVGKDGDQCICVEEIAELSGSFNYEFVCDLGKRIPRCYYRQGRLIGTKDYFDDIVEF